MADSLTLAEVADLVRGELRGEPTLEIRSVAPISSASPSDLTWVVNRSHAERLADCRAGAVLIKPDLENGRLPAVVCDRPDVAIAVILARLEPPPPHPPNGVHPSAIVAEEVTLGPDVGIGPSVVIAERVVISRGTKVHAGAYIGRESVLGEDCVVWPNVVIRERCTIGNRVIIHPNATIGADGFGYNFDQGKYSKIPHIGRVEIGDDVEIGANSCIDRAKCGLTTIGRGTKIDNLVQIGHNVQIGEDCCIIAHVGIAGSAELGRNVMLGGKVGVKDNVKIGDDVQVAACSCIAGNVAEGQIFVGIPAKPRAEFVKDLSAVRRFPGLVEKFRDLRERVEQLEAANHSKTS